MRVLLLLGGFRCVVFVNDGFCSDLLSYNKWISDYFMSDNGEGFLIGLCSFELLLLLDYYCFFNGDEWEQSPIYLGILAFNVTFMWC